ncbi:MAG: dephospho-CoA kinase, partial [Chitinophagaceae bacterium]
NELNRTFISSVVFGKKQLLDQLNAVVHPVSISHSNTWMQSQVSPYAIKEAALIFESGVNKSLDYVIGVSAPTNLRIQRTIIRDNSTVEKVLERIKNQMDEESKMKWCDHVILNDEMHLVVPQVLALHEQFLVRAG